MAVLGFLAFSCCACSSSKTGPSPIPGTGTWTGAITDALAGQGALRFVIGSSTNAITLPGTWIATFGSTTNVSGELSVTIGSGSLLLRCAASTGLVNGTVTIAGTRMTGTYVSVTSLPCPELAGGSIDLVKQ